MEALKTQIMEIRRELELPEAEYFETEESLLPQDFESITAKFESVKMEKVDWLHCS